MSSRSTPFQKQTHFPRYTHLISKRLDPIFAVAIGLSAAIVRVRREEKEKGQSIEQTWETFKRRAVITWNQPWTLSSIVGKKEVGVSSIVEDDAKRRSSSS